MSWKKEVKPDWVTWCGNVLPAGAGAISDGFSVFLEEFSDEKRYAKLSGQRSYMQVTEFPALDTTEAEPLSIDVCIPCEDLVREADAVRSGRVALKYAMVLKQQRGKSVVVNAARLRCAILVTKSEHLWLGQDGLVYLCDRADAGLDLFGMAPAPLGAIAPLEEKRSFEVEMWR